MKTNFLFPGASKVKVKKAWGSSAGKGGGIQRPGPSEPCPRSPSNHVLHPLLSPSLPPNPSGPQKLLGKLCEQNKVVREQDRLVQQLRAEKVRARGWPGVGGVWGGWHGQVRGAVSTLSCQSLVLTFRPALTGYCWGSGLCC